MVSTTKGTQCVSALPHDIRNAFDDTLLSYFLDPIYRHINTVSISPPKIACKAGHHAPLLQRAHSANMLQLSLLRSEDQSHTKKADMMTMSSFAVVKDNAKDRLISWPKVQNTLMPEPPYTDLPSPDLFTRLRLPDTNPVGFYFDLSNMFHRIRMPQTFAKFMPLKNISAQPLDVET